MLLCTRCNHVDQRPDVHFCNRCGGNLQYLIPRESQTQSNGFAQSTEPSHSFSLVRSREQHNRTITPQSMKLELYQAHEALMQGDPFWNWIGKHLAAYQTREQAKESLNDLAELQKDTLIRARQQMVDAEFARRQAEYEDAILREQLSRRRNMMADYLYELNQEFSGERYTNVPDEIKADIINSLFRQAEEIAFSPTSFAVTGQGVRSGSANDDVIIIDADEY